MSRRISGSSLEALKGAGVLAVAWAVDIIACHLHLGVASRLFSYAWDHGWLTNSSVMRDAVSDSLSIVDWTLEPLVLLLSFGLPLAFLARMVARARMRAGQSDPLEGVRAWTATNPRLARGVESLPAALWLVSVVGHTVRYIAAWGGHSMYGEYAGSAAVHRFHELYGAGVGAFGCAMAVASIVVYAATRPLAAALVAPVEIRDAEPEEPSQTGVVSERRIGFDAVAVTRETKAAVAAMAILPVFVLAAACAGKLTDAALAAAIIAQATVAIGGAVAFRRASRIAVGVDGIYVTGSSRSRFFAYRDIDAVRADGANIELTRRGRVVLRLQLHGEDALQKGAIVLRIDEAVKAAKEGETATVAEIVASASEDQLARLAQGGEGYRSASVSRAQLWSLVEGAEHDAQTRTSAARALVAAGDPSERARLRVAASQSAEPRVRVALEQLALHTEEADDEDGESSSSGLVRRIRR